MITNSYLAAFSTQIEENFRLRLGLWAIACIIVYFCLVSLSDYKKNASSQLQRLHKQVSQLEQLTDEGKWQERAEKVKALRIQYESRLLQAETIGLLQAAVQSWIDRIVKDLQPNMTRINVNLPQPVKEYDNGWYVSADMNGSLSNAEIISLLKEVESQDKLVTIDRIEVNENTRNNFILEMRIFCLVAKP